MDGLGQSDEFANLCAGYLENRRLELPVWAAALRCLDFAALAKAGHNLKGTGAAYGFAQLTGLGRALESAAHAGDAPAAAGLLARIESYLRQARVAQDKEP
jgi:HPt (histidine-containing phosphotransfer) domain-containing protein